MKGKPAKKKGNGSVALEKVGRKDYETKMAKIHEELVDLQQSVLRDGLKVCILFEGRDTAGKGGTIKALTERVSPRVFRKVALPAPTERERTQIYMQRFVEHLPAGGEVVIFDRSWYNRAGVEPVMGFCTPEEHREFLFLCPVVEKFFVEGGIQLIKYWLEVSNKKQAKRVEARIDEPLRQWKLSTIDMASRERWFRYSRARDEMLAATDTEHAPWYLVRSDDKRRARLNCIAHLLGIIPYERVPRPPVQVPKRSHEGAYDDEASIAGRRFVPERF